MGAFYVKCNPKNRIFGGREVGGGEVDLCHMLTFPPHFDELKYDMQDYANTIYVARIEKLVIDYYCMS